MEPGKAMKLHINTSRFRMFVSTACFHVYVIIDFLVKEQTQNKGTIYIKLR